MKLEKVPSFLPPFKDSLRHNHSPDEARELACSGHCIFVHLEIQQLSTAEQASTQHDYLKQCLLLPLVGASFLFFFNEDFTSSKLPHLRRWSVWQGAASAVKGHNRQQYSSASKLLYKKVISQVQRGFGGGQ